MAVQLVARMDVEMCSSMIGPSKVLSASTIATEVKE